MYLLERGSAILDLNLQAPASQHDLLGTLLPFPITQAYKYVGLDRSMTTYPHCVDVVVISTLLLINLRALASQTCLSFNVSILFPRSSYRKLKFLTVLCPLITGALQCDLEIAIVPYLLHKG